MTKPMPQPVKEFYDSLAPATQNNSRRIFAGEWERAAGNVSREYYFAKKWGFVYHYDPEFDHLDETTIKK